VLLDYHHLSLSSDVIPTFCLLLIV
jgi:hypothetical protein